jgi:ribonuclease HI
MTRNFTQIIQASNKIDAAIYQKDTDTTQLQHLGSETQYNVFAAELTAMCLSARIAHNDTCKKWDFYTYSQAAIQAIIKPGRQSGRSIIKEFLDSVDAIMNEKPNFPIIITWMPGHSEIEGNDCADLEAKKAAHNSTVGQPFHHRSLKSACKRRIDADAKRQWAEHWKNTKTAHNLPRMLGRRDVSARQKFYI